MATAIVMPRLSDTMKEGKVVKWRKAEGQAVTKGEVILEVETDKATLEVESFASGILRKILVPEGKTVRIGTNIGVIAAPDEDISRFLAPKPTLAPPPAPPPAPPKAPPAASPSPPPTAPAAPPPTAERIKVSPLARRLAAEKGIPLDTLKGTGPGGRIVMKDIEAASVQPVTAAAPGEEHELSPLAKVLAQRVTASKREAPHFYMTVEVDMGESAKMRTSLNAVDPEAPKISFNDIVLKAVALALKKHPQLNASFSGGKVIRHKRIDVGIAVALEDGIIVAVLRNCAEKGLAAIATEATDLISRARAKRLKAEEYTGSTFTVSNAGMFNVESFAAIINPPEAAILAVSSIHKVPAVVEDKIVIANRMKITLSADHRIVNGVQAAQFLNEVKRILENPINLVL
jgi:pyruvate dehydrogenase E2 component (dihydrolipoamide acetyltransferase)